MGNFNRDNGRSGGGFNRGGFGGGRGGRPSFGGGSRFGGGRGDGERPAMHKAICSECGASCELPFKPTGDRPVFCSNCFGKQQDSGAVSRPPRFGGDRHERPRFEDRQMHEAICGKCGKECQVPFKPMAGKPVFCDDCFEKGGNGGKDSGELLEQIKALHAKVDKLIAVIVPKYVPEKKVEKVEKVEVKKEVVAKKVAKEEKKEKVVKAKVATKKVAPKKVAAKKKK